MDFFLELHIILLPMRLFTFEITYMLVVEECTKEMQAKPICWKIWKTLLAEPPDKSMAKESRKFPAGSFVPGT